MPMGKHSQFVFTKPMPVWISVPGTLLILFDIFVKAKIVGWGEGEGRREERGETMHQDPLLYNYKYDVLVVLIK